MQTTSTTRKNAPTISSRVRISTFREAKMEQDGLHIFVGMPQKGIEIVDKRPFVRQNEQLWRAAKFTQDQDAKIRKSARTIICRVLATSTARIHFDRNKQILTLLSSNGYPVKGVLFAGLVKVPFQIEQDRDRRRIMWRGFPVGDGREAVVVLSKGLIRIQSSGKTLTISP